MARICELGRLFEEITTRLGGLTSSLAPSGMKLQPAAEGG